MPLTLEERAYIELMEQKKVRANKTYRPRRQPQCLRPTLLLFFRLTQKTHGRIIGA